MPCFNEAKRFKPQAFGDFLERTPDVTLVLVDDGSTDDTPLVLERLRQKFPRQVWTLRLSSNVGKAEAVRRGIRAALRRRPAMVGYWDADLATPLDVISRFWQMLQERQDLVLVMGSRVALLGRRVQRSGVRHIIGRAFATAASLVLGLPVYDSQCGAKLFRATPAVRDLLARPFKSRWIFDVEILARLIAAANECNLSAADIIYEYPLEAWTDVGGSRLAMLDFVTAGLDLAQIYWRNRKAAAAYVAIGETPSMDSRAGHVEWRDAA